MTMTKPMKRMLIGVGILFGLILAYKVFMAIMVKHYFATHKEVPTVSTATANYQDWQPQLTAAGSVRAIKGVDVTTEVGALVEKILFTPGSDVKEGQILVQLNAASDIAQLHADQAQAELAKTVYERDKKQYKVGAVSKATLDSDLDNYKAQKATAEQQAAMVAKKTLRAPFSGRVGICLINPGQYLNPGDKVVSLQTIDPVYVDFYLPQQDLPQLKVGQNMTMTSDQYPGKTYTGQITTINPGIDAATRNVEVEATVANSNAELTPGMYTAVTVDAGTTQRYLTLPQTAISYNPYGNIVYVVTTTQAKDKKDKTAKATYTAIQKFVTTGPTRGDQVAVLSGLNEGDQVVTTGQVKLKNNSEININNSVMPSDSAHPNTATKE